MNFRLLILENIILTKFLIIKNCWWKLLNWYKDELKYEINYMSLNMKSCDNYMIIKNILKNQKRKLEFELKE